MATNLTRLFVR